MDSIPWVRCASGNVFSSAGANFWAILGHFWAILAILGNFGSFLGHFFMLIFLAKYASVLFKSLFATLNNNGQI